MDSIKIPKNNYDVSHRFPSLTSLWHAHSRLLQDHRKLGNTRDLIERIEMFVENGCATGVILDVEKERVTAQSLLDYWSATLYDAGHEPSVTVLFEFDPLLAPELANEQCPYVGLYSFGEENSNYFFGRGRLVTIAMEKMKHEPLLVIVGSSGSGKSSLILAGVIPTLKNGAIVYDDETLGSQDWCYIPRTVPGSNPLSNLVRSIYRLSLEQGVIIQENIDTWVEKQVEYLKRSPEYLVTLVKEFGNRSVVLIVDQFEEVFTLCTNEEDRRIFVSSLIELMQAKEEHHKIILTMRTDFESHIARLPGFQSYFEQALMRITPPNAADLRRIIEEPAKIIGLRFDEGLVEMLIQEILGEPAALPLLQFTLLKLWDKRDRNRITWDTYNQLGGPRWALARSADDLYESLIPEQQITAKRIFLRLVRPGEGLEVTSNRVQLKTLYQSGEAADRVDRVLQRLLEARLLRLSEGDTSADKQVEVAHEALVRNWPRLVGWVEEARETIRQRLRLTEAAEKWDTLGRDETALWRGTLLKEALHFTELNELESKFVQISKETQEREEQEKIVAREKELQQARLLAKAEAQSARRLRLLLVTITTLFVMAIVLSIFYFQEQKQKLVSSFLSQGTAFWQLGEYDKALEAYELALQETQRNPEIYYERGIIFELQGNYDAAKLDYLRSIELKYESQGFPYHGLGVVSYQQGDYTNAITNFSKAIEFTPDLASAYRNRGLAYEEQHDYELAVADYLKAIELKPDFQEARNDLERIRTTINEFELTRAIENNPNDHKFYIERAEFYVELKDYRKAIQDYSSAIELSLNNANYYADRGLAYYKLEEYENAIADYTKAIEHNHKLLDWVYLARGDSYLELAEYEQAIVDYTQSISLETKFPAAYNNRGVAYFYQGNFGLAIADYNKALELDPNYANAKEGLAAASSALRRSDSE